MRLPEGALPLQARTSKDHGAWVASIGSKGLQEKHTTLLAETTQTMRFFNPNQRILEGNLTFPLPDNATVSGYALDVGGVMVDGVVVPKQEARRILEAEERKGIDPGLVEQVQGNVYRTRLYPIPARGTRTVKLTYVSDLTVAGNDAAYHLPLAHAEKIDAVSLRIEVVQAPVEPKLSGGIGNLSLHRWKDSWVAEATLGKAIPSEDLQVRLPHLPDQFTIIEKNDEGEVFFCISRKLPEVAAATWRPQRLAMAWDASGSRTNIERDLAFLKALVAAWPELVVDVLVFRERVEDQATTFAIQMGEAEALWAYLRGLAYDGGTDLTALDFSVLPHPEDEAWQVTFRKLARGMTVNEITAIVGQPVELRGDAELILIYRPSAGVVIHVRAAPKLVSVEQIMEGATLSIL